MNEKIEQCKKHIKALQESLAELEREERKNDWVSEIQIGSLVSSYNGTVFMLADAGKTLEFVAVQRNLSRGVRSAYLPANCETLDEVKVLLRKLANEDKTFQTVDKEIKLV
jgi:hypothetical protein